MTMARRTIIVLLNLATGKVEVLPNSATRKVDFGGFFVAQWITQSLWKIVVAKRMAQGAKRAVGIILVALLLRVAGRGGVDGLATTLATLQDNTPVAAVNATNPLGSICHVTRTQLKESCTTRACVESTTTESSMDNR